jgi:hypothetical protein
MIEKIDPKEKGIRQLTKVDSTMLYAVGYDEEAQILEVVFRTGGIYRYFHISRELYEGLMSAESKGQYMHAHVIGYYPYERIRRKPS